MKKSILTMNKDEFCEAMKFMYDVYSHIKYSDNMIHDILNAASIAYMSYYSERYNNTFEQVIEKERYVVENIMLFIDIIFTKVQYDGTLDPSIKNTYTLPKSIEIAYSAINYGETRDYFKMASFPNNMDGENIISTILKSVDPDYQVMIM